MFSQDRTTSTLDVMYYISRRVGLGAGWLYETFNSDDWAWTQQTLNGLSLPVSGSHQIVLTRYAYRPVHRQHRLPEGPLPLLAKEPRPCIMCRGTS